MPSIHSSLLYNETRVISDLFEVNLRQKDDEGWFSEQFRICPGCSSVIRYVKEASDIEEFTSDVEFLFDEFDWVTDTKNWQPESYSRRDASIRMLHPLLPENIELISMKDDILAELKEARIGVELWRYLLYLTILLLLIEMIVSNAKKQR